jgi:hypothetical protein
MDGIVRCIEIGRGQPTWSCNLGNTARDLDPPTSRSSLEAGARATKPPKIHADYPYQTSGKYDGDVNAPHPRHVNCARAARICGYDPEGGTWTTACGGPTINGRLRRRRDKRHCHAISFPTTG